MICRHIGRVVKDSDSMSGSDRPLDDPFPGIEEAMNVRVTLRFEAGSRLSAPAGRFPRTARTIIGAAAGISNL